VIFHCFRGSAALSWKRLSCVSLSISIQTLTSTAPSSTSILSKELISWYALLHSAGGHSPSTLSTSTLPYHERSKMRMCPAGGSFR